MVGKYYYINQETSVDLDGTFEEYDKEVYCSSDYDNTPQAKNTQNKLSALYKFRRITEYQELKLAAKAKVK